MKPAAVILLVINAWDLFVTIWNHGKVRRPQPSIIGWNETAIELVSLAGLYLLLWWGGWFK